MQSAIADKETYMSKAGLIPAQVNLFLKQLKTFIIIAITVITFSNFLL